MLLNKLIKDLKIIEIVGNTDADIRSVVSDSRQAEHGTLFVAIKGNTTDGHLFIDQAISQGSKAIICENIPGRKKKDTCYILVNNTAEALGLIASCFYGHPSRKLELIGVTGTNGKTTIVKMLYDTFSKMGYKCGYISTIGNYTGREIQETQYTTPDVLTINKLLSEMVESGCRYAFMEVSSHALSQSRTEALHFHGAVFTNISHEHLDYHNSFKEYLKAKQLLFNNLDKSSFALTNLDDKNGLVLTQNTSAYTATYSLRAMASFKGKVIENGFRGLHLQIGSKDIWSKLTGRFNAYNIMAVYGVGRLLRKGEEGLLAAISSCEPAEGRFDYFTGKNDITAIVDYAHTPDAIKNVLQNINEIKSERQRLTTVIGCGGNRDKTKRPIMALIAAKHSDRVFFTSDNPRFEDPDQIIKDMVDGLDVNPDFRNKYFCITDRKEAIKLAASTVDKGDIILVAGKGHEKYQEIKGEKILFDDKQILEELLNR